MVRSSLLVSAILCAATDGARLQAHEPTDRVWVQQGEEYTVCHSFSSGAKIGSEEECKAQAENAGSTFYSFTSVKGGRCKHGTKCRLRSGTKWNWKVYKLEEATTTPKPAATTPEPVPEVVAPVVDLESVETTTEEPEAETTTKEPVAETTTEEPVAETTTEEPVAETTTEEPVAETTTEEPVAETTTEEPVAETTTEESVAETTTEEPVAETSTEEPVAKTTATRVTTVPPTTTERVTEPASYQAYIFGDKNTNGCADGVPFESGEACKAAAEESGYGFLGMIFTPARPAGCYRSGQTVAFNKHPTGMASSICEPMCVNQAAGGEDDDLPVGACCVCKGSDQGYEQMIMVGEEGKAVEECQEECEEYCEEEGASFHSCVDAKGVLALRESFGVDAEWEDSGELCDWPGADYDGSA